MSQPDVARVQRRKDVEDALAVVREAFYKQDWEGAKAALQSAEQVDPNAPQLQVYKNLLTRKLAEQQGSTGPTLRTPKPGVAAVTPGYAPPSTPFPSAVQADVTPTPSITTPTNAVPAAAPQPDYAGRKKKLFVVLGAAALAGLLWFLYKRFAGSRQARVTAEEPMTASAGLSAGILPLGDIPSPRTPVAPPPKMMFADEHDDQVTMVEDQATMVEDQVTMVEADGTELSRPFTRKPVEDQPQDEESLARAIAKNLEQFKPQVPEATPSFDMFSGAVSADSTNYMENAGNQSEQAKLAASFAAPPKPAGPETKTAAKTPEAPAKESETVSFEDLGINFGPSEPAPAPPAPAAAPAEPPVAAAPTSPAPAPEITPAPAPAAPKPAGDISIRLDDLTVATPPKVAPAVAPPSKPLSTEGAIDLQQVLFGKSPEAPSVAPSAAAQALNTPAPSQEEKPPVQLSLDDFGSGPAAAPTPAAPAKAAPPQDDTYGAYGDTFHSQDTIGLGGDTQTHSGDALNIDGTVGFGSAKSQAPIDPALAATKTSSQPSATPESYYGATPKGGASQLDERSEKMFREQYDRAQKAMNDRNWRQAVHYLSIAAAIHPDNEQVREQLKQARAEKRKQEAGV
jgi:hypothetical protein